MNNNELLPNMPSEKKIKPVSEQQMKAFGLNKENVQMVETLEILEKNPPNIVIAECIRNIGFIQNHYKQQTLTKKNKYIMGLGMFQQLHYDLDKNIKILKPAKIKFKDLYRPYKGQNLDNQTLVVSRHGGIGDLLFILPNLIYLKEKYPTCTIKFCCGPQYRSMVESWDCVDQIINLPFSLQQFVCSDFHLFLEGVIERCKEAETVNAYNLFSRWAGLDLPDEKLVPKQNPKSEKVEECKKILDKWNLKEKEFIIICPRASSPIRCADPKFWIHIINKLNENGYDVLITDSQNQAEGIERFLSLSKNKNKVFNFAKYSNSIDMSIAMTSMAKLVISTDSGLMHIGVSLGIKSFGIYGPFPGYIRLKTYPKELCDWIEPEADCFPCIPCFKHGHFPCEKARMKNLFYSLCYDTIKPEKIIEKIERLLSK